MKKVVLIILAVMVHSAFAQLDPSSTRKYTMETIGHHDDECTGVFINKANTMMATSSMDETIKLWDLNTLKEIRTLTGHRGTVYNISFNWNDSLIASGSADRTIPSGTSIPGSACTFCGDTARK